MKKIVIIFVLLAIILLPIYAQIGIHRKGEVIPSTKSIVLSPPPKPEDVILPRWSGNSIFKQEVPRWAWTKAVWSGDNVRWREARLSIDRAITNGTTPENLFAQCKAAYLKSHNDRLKLFEWAYTFVRARTAYNYDIIVQGLSEAMAKQIPPYNYEFMRVRYLMVCHDGFSNDALIALGERLHEYDPNDYQTLYHLAVSISKDTPEARTKAFEYVDLMIKLKPDLATGYGIKAAKYYFYWVGKGHTEKGSVVNDDVDDARLAVQWYEEYLRRETRDTPPVKQDIEGIKLVVERLKKWLTEHGEKAE